MKITLGFFCVCFVWGTSYLAIKVGVEDISPILLCSLRYLIASPLLFIFALHRGERLPTKGCEYFWLILTAVLVLVIPGGLIAWAQKHIDSQIAALLMSSTSIWVCVMAWFGGDRQTLTGWAVTGIAVGILSLFLIIDVNVKQPLQIGYIAILLAAIIFSLGTIVFRKYMASNQVATSAAFHLLIAGSIMFVVTVWSSPAPQWHVNSVAALLYLAIINSAMSLMIYYWLVQSAPVVLIGTPNLVVPAIAMLASRALTQESLSASQLTGAILMILALGLILLPPSVWTKLRQNN